MATFLDIEEAFNNATSHALVEALARRGIEPTLCQWGKARCDNKVIISTTDKTWWQSRDGLSTERHTFAYAVGKPSRRVARQPVCQGLSLPYIRGRPSNRSKRKICRSDFWTNANSSKHGEQLVQPRNAIYECLEDTNCHFRKKEKPKRT